MWLHHEVLPRAQRVDNALRVDHSADGPDGNDEVFDKDTNVEKDAAECISASNTRGDTTVPGIFDCIQAMSCI